MLEFSIAKRKIWLSEEEEESDREDGGSDHRRRSNPWSKKYPQIQTQTHGSFDLSTEAAWVCCFSVNLLLDFVVFWVCSLRCLQWCLPSLFSTLSYGFFFFFFVFWICLWFVGTRVFKTRVFWCYIEGEKNLFVASC